MYSMFDITPPVSVTSVSAMSTRPYSSKTKGSAIPWAKALWMHCSAKMRWPASW
jgi:hypothetical protein